MKNFHIFKKKVHGVCPKFKDIYGVVYMYTTHVRML